MNKKQNIVRLVAAMILTVTMMLSLSSCVLDMGVLSELFEIYFSDNSGEGGDGNGGDGGQNNDGENNGGDSGNNGGDELPIPGGDSNGGFSDNIGEFYPGSGSGSTDGLSPMAKTLLSSVTIICDFGGSGAAGSGVIYKIDKEKGDAYILTNYHVVYSAGYGRASAIKLYLYGMHLESYAVHATLLGGSVTYDIAVLKVSGSEVIKNSYARATEISAQDSARVFDRVYAVGNSEGMGMSATEGIVSVESENLDLTGADNSMVSLRVVRFDAAVNHGNSGGGLYNASGELVGIVVAKDVSADVDNMGYAIPSDLAVRVAENIIAHCDGVKNLQVSKPLLGITITAYVSGLEISPDGSEIYQVNLVEVVEVSGGSLALGKVRVGDIINSITVDGVTHRVTRVHHVTDAMLETRGGSTVVLNITSDGKTLEVSFTIPASSFTPVR